MQKWWPINKLFFIFQLLNIIRRLEARNFAVTLVFIPLTTYRGKGQLFKISGSEFYEWLFGPEKFSGLYRRRPLGISLGGKARVTWIHSWYKNPCSIQRDRCVNTLLSSIERKEMKLTWATKQLHSHTNPAVPCSGMDLDVGGTERRKEAVINHRVPVAVAGEKLWERTKQWYLRKTERKGC